MKKWLFRIWRILPYWLQELAGIIVRPRYQVAVGALIFNEGGQLLLCEHSYRRVNPWGLPGGDLKFGEDPVEGIKRELYEETGLRVHNPRLILVENSSQQRHVTLIYHCYTPTGEFIPNDEVIRMQYFDLDTLPEFVPMQKVALDRALEILKSGGQG